MPCPLPFSPHAVVGVAANGGPVCGPPRTLSAATKHSTCASAQLPFPLSFPPFLNSVLSPSLLLQQLPPSISNYEGAANTFPPPLSLSSPPSNNNTKATNAKSVPRLCQLLLVGLVHSFFFFSRSYREGWEAGQPPCPSFFFHKRKNAMVKRRFVEKNIKK